jgi:purine-binding chemotaxis protein CheW
MLATKESIPDILQNKSNLVTFRLNRVHYAIAIEPLQQIIEMVTITPVLSTEAWMEGVINYHGLSIPVVNLRRHFGLEVVPYRWHTPIMLVNISGRLVGLIVDDVLDVLAVPKDQISDPRAILPAGIPETSLLKGIIQMGENITLLINLAHLFDQRQVRVLGAVADVLTEQPDAKVEAQAPVKKPAAKKKGGSAKGKARKTVETPSAPKNEVETPVEEEKS